MSPLWQVREDSRTKNLFLKANVIQNPRIDLQDKVADVIELQIPEDS
jgi:hypothetical protein